jgi:uncharacterized protein
MNYSANRTLLEEAFAALEKGDGKPFFELLANDVLWTISGTIAWSGTYRGKAQVQSQLLKPLFAQFAERYKAKAARFVTEKDVVVVEFEGGAKTKTGRVYENRYCWICTFNKGLITELTEYTDTHHVVETLDRPAG